MVDFQARNCKLFLLFSKGPMDDRVVRAKLERLLSGELRKVDPRVSAVKVSFDCEA